MTTTAIPLLTKDEVACCRPGHGDEPGFGALRTPQGNLPLKLLHVDARILGLLCETTVRQTFVNVLGVPIEATYVFPLPDRAAVTRFRLEVGERVVEGVLQDRGQARQTYDRAISDGHRAAIAEEERPGVFTLRVGNLVPGDEATVWLTLDGPLPFQDGEATFQFPLVVAPRYIPGRALDGPGVGSGTATDTDAVPDASRITPPVLLPGFPNPVALSIEVEVDGGGLPVTSVRSSLHAVHAHASRDGTIKLRILPGERLDRDFILRFGLGAGKLGSSLSVRPDAEDPARGTFLLTLVPPPDALARRRPKDVVLIIDRSGSMEGWKMVAARRAAARVVDTLTAADRFAVYAFDDQVDTPPSLGLALAPATDRNRFRAVEFLAKLESRGGAGMARPLAEAIKALSPASEGAAREQVLVFVTDGQVGNEDQLLKTLGVHAQRLRVFTLGVDKAVNAAFLRRLAALGGGSCELVESEDRLDEVMDKVHRRIDAPVLSRLRLVGEGVEVEPEALVPGRLPDLFPGAPLVVLGRCRGSGGTITVEAQDSSGLPWRETLPAGRHDHPSIGPAWARGQVRQLEDRYILASTGAEKDALEKRIVGTSLAWSVLCRFTAFVAVDRAAVVNQGGVVHQVTQAVEQPAGWAQQAQAHAAGALNIAAAPAVRRSGSPAPAKKSRLMSGDDSGATFGAVLPARASAPPPAPAAPAGGFVNFSKSAAPPSAPAGSFSTLTGGGPIDLDAFAAAPSALDANFEGLNVEAEAPLSLRDETDAIARRITTKRVLPPEPTQAPPPAPSAGSGSGLGGLIEKVASIFGGGDPKPAPTPPAPKPWEVPSARMAPPPSQPVTPPRVSPPIPQTRAATPPAGVAVPGGSDPVFDGYRRRAQPLVEALARGPGSGDERRRELARLLMQLEELLEDLRTVGAPAALVQPLEALVAELGVVRSQPSLAAAEVDRLWRRATEVLEGFVRGAAPPAPSRGSFWK